MKSQKVTETQGIQYPFPRLLTIKEGAKYIGLTTWALRERIWQGLIPVVTFPGGRKQYIDIRDIDHFIEKNKHRETF